MASLKRAWLRMNVKRREKSCSAIKEEAEAIEEEVSEPFELG